YPFGLKHDVYAPPQQKYELDEEEEEMARPTYVYETEYQYKFGAKEWQDELGLNMYNMDMRQYDPAIARWIVLDPIVHHSMSPYNAFDNNPVFWADPSGADAVNIGYDRVVDSQDLNGSVQWSGGFDMVSIDKQNS